MHPGSTATAAPQAAQYRCCLHPAPCTTTPQPSLPVKGVGQTSIGLPPSGSRRLRRPLPLLPPPPLPPPLPPVRGSGVVSPPPLPSASSAVCGLQSGRLVDESGQAWPPTSPICRCCLDCTHLPRFAALLLPATCSPPQSPPSFPSTCVPHPPALQPSQSTHRSSSASRSSSAAEIIPCGCALPGDAAGEVTSASSTSAWRPRKPGKPVTRASCSCRCC